MEYIVASDIHLGHLTTPTEHIIQSFIKTILTEENKRIDILFISGDLFDQLLNLKSKEISFIINFFNYLLNYCYDNNIVIRVLEGTRSHDWLQASILCHLNDIRVLKCDLKHFKVLDIEYLEKFNKYILYIPDEWVSIHSTLENQIKAKLNIHNIAQVDIAILHGQFKYQINSHYKGFYFNEDYFLRIVKDYIHIGHYHTHSYFDRIIAGGSLERLAHGQEEAKGYILVNDNVWTFVENRYSYTYKTITITKKTTLAKLDLIISKLPKGGHIRLRLNKDHDFSIDFNNIKLRYLDYHLKKKYIDDKHETHVTNIHAYEDIEDLFVLDTDIHQLLATSIPPKYNFDPKQTKLFYELIEPLKKKESDLS